MATTSTNILPFNHLAVTKAGAREGKQTEWRIDGVRGLVLVISPSGTATWFFRYQVAANGKRLFKSVKLGRRDAVTLQEARTAAEKLRHDVESGLDPVAEEAKAIEAAATKAKALTFRQLFEERCAKDDRRSERTLADYREALERDVFAVIGDKAANEIDADAIVAVLEPVEARSKHAAHKVRSAIGSTFRWGMSRRKVKHNPCVGLGFIHASKPRKIVATDDELAALWKAFDNPDLASEPMRLVLKLAMLTGQRNSEVAGAQRSELSLDVENPRWTIPAERMKRKSDDQIIPLSKHAAELFRRALSLSKHETCVFEGTTHGRLKGHEWRAEHLSQESVSRAMARARELAGVDDIRVHDLRKCVTTWLAERFERPDILDRILHHVPRGVTGTHYDFSVLEGPLRAALQRWEDHVLSLRNGTATGNVVQLRQPATA